MSGDKGAVEMSIFLYTAFKSEEEYSFVLISALGSISDRKSWYVHLPAAFDITSGLRHSLLNKS